jgi:HPr kinase/phosphorylase
VAVHATTVAIGAAGAPFGASPAMAALLLGPPGAGKSDVALRLIAMGAKLVSDDQTMLSERDGVLYAHPHPSSRGHIELRGAGIVRLETAAAAPVGLAVTLGNLPPAERLPEPAHYVPPAPLRILLPPPLLRLAAFDASTPAKIAAVAAALASGGFVAGAAGDI